MELMGIVAGLKNASMQMLGERIDQFIEAVDTHEQTLVYGTRKSDLILEALAMRPMQIGYQSYMVGETTTSPVGRGDLLIVASASRKTQSVYSAADDGARQGTGILVIIGSKGPTLSGNHESLIRIEAAIKLFGLKANIQPLGSLSEQMLLSIFDTITLRMSSKNVDAGKEMAEHHASVEQ